MAIIFLFLCHAVNAIIYIAVNAFIAIKLVNYNKHKTYLEESDYVFVHKCEFMS